MACGDEIPVTIEYRRLWFSAGTLIDPVKYCVDADTDCCGSGTVPEPGGDPECCTGEYVTDLIAEFTGPFGEGCASQTRTASLVWNAESLSWEGTSDESAEGDYVVVSVWCDGSSFYGVVEVYRAGVFLTSFELAPTASGDGTTLVESVDVADLSCDPNTVTVEIEHPCPTGGGGVAACGCSSVPSTLYATFAGSLSTLGTITLTYLTGTTWRGTLPDVSCCPGGGSAVDFTCTGGGTWEITTAHPSLSFTGTETSEVCAPFAVGLSGTASGPFCSGAFTVTVDDVP